MSKVKQMRVDEWVEKSAKNFPEKIAIKFKNQSLKYKELISSVEETAAFLPQECKLLSGERGEEEEGRGREKRKEGREEGGEEGSEITARPPGTRLKTLALLSGGQKTMTAVALLFAIYMVKPSPFCLLDELDAPLDDANIGRFVSMLQQFTEFSQFIIITHNKRTIASSDSIFGVTMQEKGVSKLVSMRFNVESGRTEEIGVNRESSVES